MSFCYFCVITIPWIFSVIPNRAFWLALLIPLVCKRRLIIARTSYDVTWKDSCSPSMSSGSLSSSLSNSILFFLFTYSLKHSFQCIITELIGEWKLEISLSKSIYSSAVKSYSASFISVSSLKSSENSSFNSDSSFSTLCCTIPHFAKQFLIVVSETYFQGAATHVIPWGMSKSLAISDALRSFEILGITWRNKFFLIFYLEVFNDACI